MQAEPHPKAKTSPESSLGLSPGSSSGAGDVPRHPAGAVPRHVAVIMDGNGRWAAARGLPRVAGHRAGAGAVRRTIETAAQTGVGWLTLYAFSSENWRRPPRK